MVEGELYGLLVIAKEQQAAAEKQAQTAREAVAALSEAVIGIPGAAQGAARTAFAAVDQALHDSVTDACEKLRGATDRARRVTRAVAWWEFGAAFLLGAVLVAVGGFLTIGPQFGSIEQAALAACQQATPGHPRGTSR